MVTPLLIGDDGRPPLPWLAAPLQRALASQRGHAVLVQGSEGIGALPFTLSLAQSWLCECARDGATVAARRPACGRCGSCHLVATHVHPDLFVLMPEVLRRQHAWPLRDDKIDGEDSKRKPSKQVRIDEVRALIDWTTRTSARGRGKVAVLHPAESLNQQSANALLKTLEEPPAGTRLLLCSADPARLLPTLRSRCQSLKLATPDEDVATAWLAERGVAQAGVLLAACSGRPLDVLAWTQAGVDAAAWAALPRAVAAGQGGALSAWPVPLALDALLKLCHDATALAHGALPRYFPRAAMPAGRSNPSALRAWAAELARVARHAEHPWNEGLLAESLVGQAERALMPADAGPGTARTGVTAGTTGTTGTAGTTHARRG